MGSADLVIVGRIATLAGERGWGWVEALAIEAGRVVAVGRAADVETFVGHGTTLWRLATDQVVLPSLTDAHLHLTDAASASEEVELGGLDLGGCARAIQDAHLERTAPEDEEGWLLGHGWSVEWLGSSPTSGLLDRAAPGRAVALWSHDHHARWLSSEGLRRAGLEQRPDPPGGRIVRDVDGHATGLLLEAAAGLADAAIPEIGPERAVAAIDAFARRLAGLGVTSVHDPGGLAPDPELRRGPTLYRGLARDRRLPLRVTASVRQEQLERAITLGFRSGSGLEGAGAPDEAHRGPEHTALGVVTGRYRDGWLKLFSDGALGSRTAHLSRPYESDDPAGPPPGGPTGMALLSHERLSALCRHAAAHGIASQVHAIGDAAVRTALEVLEAMPRVGEVRHRVEHAQLIDPSDVPRFGRAGVAASVQACHLLTDAPAMRRAWGVRTANAFPLAALDASGALLPLGTDAPVEPPDPWPGIAAAVARRGGTWDPDAAFHPEQGIGLERAWRAACLDGPRSAGVSDEGHLGLGARADLMIVPETAVREPIDVAALSATRPLATLLDGEIVHRAAAFDP